MKLIESPVEFQRACDEARTARRRVGLVPTMGALHAGHLSLIDRARAVSDWVAVTIFVNPTQFGPNEDLARYPRDLEGDLEKCRERGVDLVFTPRAAEMYPPGDATRVSVNALSKGLCGASRPGHFTGVCTVVSKLFHLAGRSVAVFGRKDYQQLKVIERMTQDLFFPIDIIAAPTLREPDGLAMSSRNLRLSPEARRSALGLVQGLRSAHAAFASGERRAPVLLELARRPIEQNGLRADYVALVDAGDLSVVDATAGERALLAVAAFAGDVRLIDNLVLGEDAAPVGVSA